MLAATACSPVALSGGSLLLAAIFSVVATAPMSATSTAATSFADKKTSPAD
ncbi:hypothetical protein [Nannocystis pusilla]|uniref:hypothetical protein n=1 Tax=Nannocystis pusilla TaxID=889268 RepID=UPI003B7D8D29